MTVTVTPLSATLGARIEGIDLRQTVTGAALAALRRAFRDHQVVCLPGQKISAANQIAFCALFGAADADYKVSAQRTETDYRKGVMLVSNVRKNGVPIGNLPDGDMQFHSDGCHRDRPYLATTLYAIRVPRRGGDTLFANLTAPMTRSTRTPRRASTDAASTIPMCWTPPAATKSRAPAPCCTRPPIRWF